MHKSLFNVNIKTESWSSFYSFAGCFWFDIHETQIILQVMVRLILRQRYKTAFNLYPKQREILCEIINKYGSSYYDSFQQTNRVPFCLNWI